MDRSEQRSADYWKAVIEDFLKSKKSQKEYTNENKISRAALWSWSKQLGIPLNRKKKHEKDAGEESPALSFVEVQPISRTSVCSSIEVIFPQGHILKLAAEGTWEEVGIFIKTMMR